MSRAHTAWLKALLETIPGAVDDGYSRVFVSKAVPPDGAKTVPFPYWVIHPAAGRNSAERVTGPYVTKHPRFTIHSNGADADQAALAGELVEDKLVQNGLGVRPAVTGESAKRVWYSSPIPIQVDDGVKPEVFIHIAECGWEAEPAG